MKTRATKRKRLSPSRIKRSCTSSSNNNKAKLRNTNIIVSPNHSASSASSSSSSSSTTTSPSSSSSTSSSDSSSILSSSPTRRLRSSVASSNNNNSSSCGHQSLTGIRRTRSKMKRKSLRRSSDASLSSSTSTSTSSSNNSIQNLPIQSFARRLRSHRASSSSSSSTSAAKSLITTARKSNRLRSANSRLTRANYIFDEDNDEDDDTVVADDDDDDDDDADELLTVIDEEVELEFEQSQQLQQSPSPPPPPPQNQSKKTKRKECKSSPPVKVAPDECLFCRTHAVEVYELGELKRCDDIAAHMHCLYFAPGLTQNGDPQLDGIEGFLLADIRRELKRGTLLKCTYCGKRGAVVGCTVPECKINYHLPCGIANGAFNQFHDPNHSFPSFCVKHRPNSSVPKFTGRVRCTICQEDIRRYRRYADARITLLYVRCCATYFHRACLVKLAYHQGEFHLKCPNCKNERDFVQTLKRAGIHVPCRDATWELSGELNSTDVVFRCVAPVCRCALGRAHNGDNEWELFACDRCGSNAVHVSCAALDETTGWLCEICASV